jgi:hypothetical protein
MLRSSTQCLVLIVLGAVACGASPVMSQTIAYVNDYPEFQMYFYPTPSSNGPGSVRDRAPTFGGYSSSGPTGTEFYEGTSRDPSRRGSFFIAGDTSADIPLLQDVARYQINSAKIRVTMMATQVAPDFGFFLPYDNTLDASSAITSAMDADPGYPLEMYGVDFQAGKEQFGFGPDETAAKYFRLGDQRWTSGPEDPYRMFGIDANGRDVENSIVGGYSATEASGHTTQFTPEPFAIGRAYDALGNELTPGADYTTGDEIEFELNLALPGVVQYLQQSLAKGYVGFAVSSLHPTSGQTGNQAYPDFYLDDLDVGPNPDGAGPSIELDVTILPESSGNGDFDFDNDVDGNDFLIWQRELGGSLEASDLQAWKADFGNGAGSLSVAQSVPEPSTILLSAATTAFLYHLTRRRVISVGAHPHE